MDGSKPYVNGDPSIGRAGSIPPAAAFEYPMREIVNLLVHSGLTPSDEDLHQILKAIRTYKINHAVDVGTTDNLACAFDPPLEAYNDGFVVRIKVAHGNSGPAQIDCGPGYVPIVHFDGAPLSAGDVVPGMVAVLVYQDGSFQLTNPSIANIVQQVTGISGGLITGENTIYQTFNYSGGYQGMYVKESAGTFDWTVPAGVRKIWLRLWAGGGPGVEWNQSANWMQGGDGGYVEALFDVVPATLMRIVVGAGAPPPVPVTTGNITYNSTNWKNTRGGSSTFGPAGQAVWASCTGGQGCFIDPPGDMDPSFGRPGVGTVTGAAADTVVTRANGLYGKGGGQQASDGVYDDYIEATGDDGAAIIMY